MRRSGPVPFPLPAELAIAHFGCNREPTLDLLCRLADDAWCTARPIVQSEHLDLRPLLSGKEMRLQVVDGELFAACARPPRCGYFRGTLQSLAALQRYARLPDLDVILSRKERLCEKGALSGRWSEPRGETVRAPVFSTETREGDADCENVLLPPRALLSTLSDNVRAAAAALRQPAWSQRQRRAVWRGNVWGQREGRAARERLVNTSRARPDLLDAEAAAPGSPSFLPWPALLRYRAVIALDGFTLPDRLSYLVSGGFAIAWQRGEWAEGWYRYLQPWVHYAPLRSDLADLVPVLEQLQHNDSLSRTLAANAAAAAARYLSRRAITCHWLTLLHGYAPWVRTPVRLAPGAFRVSAAERQLRGPFGSAERLLTLPEHVHHHDPIAPSWRQLLLRQWSSARGSWHEEPCFPGLDAPTCVDLWR